MKPRPAGPGVASPGLRVRFAACLTWTLLSAVAAPTYGMGASPDTGPIPQKGEPPSKSEHKGPARTSIRPAVTPGTKVERPHRTGGAPQLPGHARSDTGKVADPSRLHGDSKIEEATAGFLPEERRIVPIAPAPAAPAPAQPPTAPPEKPIVPAQSGAAPEEAPSPTLQGPADATAEPDATAAKPITAVKPSTTAAKLAATAAQLAATAAKLAATAARLAATAAQASATESKQPTHKASAPASTARNSPGATASPTTMAPAPPSKTGPEGEANPEMVTLDESVFDQIRLEIKGRLPYFQACADAARRRGSLEVRVVQATWIIAADGAIKEMKVEGAPDPKLATCITRMGSQPFTAKPGMDLTIPTPIVFVR